MLAELIMTVYRELYGEGGGGGGRNRFSRLVQSTPETHNNHREGWGEGEGSTGTCKHTQGAHTGLN